MIPFLLFRSFFIVSSERSSASLASGTASLPRLCGGRDYLKRVLTDAGLAE